MKLALLFLAVAAHAAIDISQIPANCLSICAPNAGLLLTCQEGMGKTPQDLTVCQPVCPKYDEVLKCLECAPVLQEFIDPLKNLCKPEAPASSSEAPPPSSSEAPPPSSSEAPPPSSSEAPPASSSEAPPPSSEAPPPSSQAPPSSSAPPPSPVPSSGGGCPAPSSEAPPVSSSQPPPAPSSNPPPASSSQPPPAPSSEPPPAPSSSTPPPAPSSQAPPASSSQPPPAPSSSTPPTQSSVTPPQPSTSSVPFPDISKLSPCALQCILGEITTQKCSGPTDSACICTESFINGASKCFSEKCPTLDALPGLDLTKATCPDMDLPDLSGLDECGQTCILETLPKAGCQGPLDRKCICGVSFPLKTSACLLKSCGLTQLPPALKLQFASCKATEKSQCSTSGLFALLSPSCWIPWKRDQTNNLYYGRRGTPAAAMIARRAM